MSYAGKIGKIEGVKIHIAKGKDLKVRPTIQIEYYAWNARTLSNPGYGTKKLEITAYFSPTTGNDEYAIMKFASIPGSGNGESGLKKDDYLPCGRVTEVTSKKSGDHKYNTISIELDDSVQEKLNHSVSFLYSASVNDDKQYSDIAGMIVEAKGQ